MTKALKCFIAMAFNNKDTDKLYSKSIKPIIQSLGIQPRCLNTIEHNDDLNNRIIQEIEAADLILADLTFARPSVYYEAGFGERSIPAIYTCRRDHLKPRPSDPNGNLKVHFDLQMKNIIPWNKPDDPLFRKKLAKRLKFVTKPLKAKIIETALADSLKKSFHLLPTRTKLSQIRESSIKASRLSGFGKLESYDDYGWMARTFNRKRSRVLYVVFAQSLSKKLISDILYRAHYSFRTKMQKEMRQLFPRTQAFDIDETIVFCTLARLAITKVKEHLPQAALDPSSNFLEYTVYEDASGGFGHKDSGRIDFFYNIQLHVIDNIPYLERFNDSFKRIITSANLSRHAG